MDVYELSVDLRPGVRDLDFVAALDTYLGALAADGETGVIGVQLRLTTGLEDRGEIHMRVLPGGAAAPPPRL